jgi:sugar/nucleoside kinase (ribokinase family)
VTGRFDVIAVGRPSLDLIFTGLPRWPVIGLDMDVVGFDVCAGASFNTVAAATRLGLRVGYVSMVGNDACSELVLREFAAEGIPTELLRTLDRPMTFVSASLNHDGDRGFVTYVEDAGEDDPELGRIAADVVSSGVGRHLHLYADAEPHLPRLAHAAGMTVSLDASDGPWWDPAAPLETVLEHADVVFANEAEAVAMTGAPDVETALALLAEHAACVVIKRGADGAIGRSGDEIASSPAELVHTVDTTGAGDCFNAGFLYGWLRGMPLGEALTIANICAGGAVTAFGGYRGCPREAAMLRIAATRGITVPPMGARP